MRSEGRQRDDMAGGGRVPVRGRVVLGAGVASALGLAATACTAGAPTAPGPAPTSSPVGSLQPTTAPNSSAGGAGTGPADSGAMRPHSPAIQSGPRALLTPGPDIGPDEPTGHSSR